MKLLVIDIDVLFIVHFLYAGIEELARDYFFGGRPTKLGLCLVLGGDERVFRMNVVSNDRFTPSEYEWYVDKRRRDGLKPLSVEEVTSRYVKLRDVARNHTYTETEIAALLKRKEDSKRDKIVNFASARTSLNNDLLAAHQRNDTQAIEKIKERLADLDSADESRKRRREAIISVLSDINRRNDQANFASEQAVKRMKVDPGISDGREQQGDPFLRRHCRPSILWTTGAVPSEQLSNMKQSSKTSNEGLGYTISKSPNAQEVPNGGGMQLLEIEVSEPVDEVLPSKPIETEESSHHGGVTRRNPNSLSLKEYFSQPRLARETNEIRRL